MIAVRQRLRRQRASLIGFTILLLASTLSSVWGQPIQQPKPKAAKSSEEVVDEILETDFNGVKGATKKVVRGPRGFQPKTKSLTFSSKATKSSGKGKGVSEEGPTEGALDEPETIESDSDSTDEGGGEDVETEETGEMEEAAEPAQPEEPDEETVETVETGKTGEAGAPMQSQEDDEEAEVTTETGDDGDEEDYPIMNLDQWDEIAEQDSGGEPDEGTDNWNEIDEMPAPGKKPAFPAGEPVVVRGEIPSDDVFLQFTGGFDLTTDEEPIVETIDVLMGQYLSWGYDDIYSNHEVDITFLQPDDNFRRELIALEDLEEGTNVAYARVAVLIRLANSNPSLIFSFMTSNATDALEEFFDSDNIAHLLTQYSFDGLKVDTVELIEPDEIEFPDPAEELPEAQEIPEETDEGENMTNKDQEEPQQEEPQTEKEPQQEEPQQQEEPIDEDMGADEDEDNDENTEGDEIMDGVVAGANQQETGKSKRSKILLSFLIIVCALGAIGFVALILFTVRLQREARDSAPTVFRRNREETMLLDDESETTGKPVSTIFPDFLDAPRMGEDETSHSTNDSVGLRMVDGPDLVARTDMTSAPPSPLTSRSARSFGQMSEGRSAGTGMDEYGDLLHTINVDK